MKRSFSVIIPSDLRPKPTKRELVVAYIIASYFQKDVEFVARGLLKSADFYIGGEYRELKSPSGQGKHNIQHTLERVVKQCENIIFDAYNSRIHANRIKCELKRQKELIRGIRRVILIEKDGKLLK